MASSTIAPADPYLGTNVIDNQNDAVAWEVADFLFGAKSIKNIAEGNGTWGDAAVIGITAATFLIPPAKIALLGNKALRKVLAETITVNASTGSLPVVAKAIAKTRAEVEAELVRRGKLTYAESLKAQEPLIPMSEARFKSITSPEPETKFVPEGLPFDKYNPRNEGIGRPFDEDYDSFRDRDRNPAQEADDYIAMQGIGNKKKLLTKEELDAKDVESAQYYDKRKFTQDEIETKIDRLTDKQLNSPQLKRKQGESKEDYEARLEDYVRADEYEPKEIQRIVEQLIKDNKRAADIDSKEVKSIFLSLIRILKSEEIKRTVSPEVYKGLSRSFKEFEKEFEDTVVDIVEAKAVLKKYETNLPDEKFAEKRIPSKDGIKYEEGDIKPQGSSIRYEEDITDDSEFGAVKTIADDMFDRTGDEASRLKPGTGTSYDKKVPNPEVLKIKIPEEARMDKDLREGLSIPAQKFAELQALIDKLTTFNKSNTRKLRYASADELADLKEKSIQNQNKIERYQRELLIIKKTLSEEEVINAVKVSEEITKRALERRRYPLGVPEIKKALPSEKAIAKNPEAYRIQAGPKTTEKVAEFTGKNSEVTVHSGGADGSDTAWAEAADRLGIKTNGHSFEGHETMGSASGFVGKRPALETRNILTKEQLEIADESLKKAAKSLDRPFNPKASYVNLLRRNYYQLKDSEAVVAVGEILTGGTKVNGGTGWAVQMGIDKGIPVYVFDQKVKLWAVWNGSKFEKLSGFPPKFKEFAGVGTRELNDDGRKAIEEYMEQYVSRGTKAKVAESTGSVVKWNELTTAQQANTVYIGRGTGDKGKFGNPFKVVPQFRTVKQALQEYGVWLQDKIKTDLEYARDIYSLKGKTIACPGPESVTECHGQIILKAIKYLDEHPELMEGK